MGSRYFEGNRLELSSSCVTQKFNNILSGPLKGTWPHEILFYYVYDDAKQNYLMDHHTKNLCYTHANELLIFSWNSEFVDEHQLQVSFGWSRLDWTRRRRQSAKFDCDLNQTKTRGIAELLWSLERSTRKRVKNGAQVQCQIKERKCHIRKSPKVGKTKSQF